MEKLLSRLFCCINCKNICEYWKIEVIKAVSGQCLKNSIYKTFLWMPKDFLDPARNMLNI